MSTINPLNYIVQLDQIFEDKQWKKKENYTYVYERLGDIFSKNIFLSDEEYELMLELVNRFEWISFNDYYSAVIQMLTELLNNLETRSKNIYVFPIIRKKENEKDHYKIKSGSMISYIFKSILPMVPKGENYNFEDINTFEDLKRIKFNNSDTFILVDDFIGSGETLNNCIRQISIINKPLSENLTIFCISVLKDTLQKIQLKYKIYYKIEILKGISDYNVGDEIENKKIVMQNIENRIFDFNKIKNYSLGFSQSECLISLLRTPDNTFPIFWQSFKKKLEIKPPFPRYEKA